jgi:hypothetical protein
VLAAWAGGSNGLALAGLTTLLESGPPDNRVDMVFVGDGYTQGQLDAGLYANHVLSYADNMFTADGYLNDPFSRYAKFFNIHAIDVASTESGADKPTSGIFVDTALDATYDSSGLDRLLTINNAKASALRDQTLSGTGISADMQLAVVNDSRYGGAGGPWAVFAGDNFNAFEIALHELGHSFSNLADEYTDLPQAYTGSEPSNPNATKDPGGAKWAHWHGFDDPRGDNLDIDAFEGALRFATGVYRPSAESKMRSLGREFDAVSREAFILDIYNYVDPLDAWLPNGAPLTDAVLWIDLVDPAVQGVDWYVDDVLVPEAHGETFDPTALGVGPGTHRVRADAYDRVIEHAMSGDLLDLVRKDFDRLRQTVEWTLTTTEPIPGDFDGDGDVDALDLARWTERFAVDGGPPFQSGDGDGDGDVDGADFLGWQQNLGAAGGPGATVPEPAPLWAGIGATAVALQRVRGWPRRPQRFGRRERLV